MQVEQGEEQVFLGWKVAIERRRLHADVGGDLAHRHRLVAMAGEQIERGGQDRRLRLLTEGASRPCHGYH